MDTVTISALEVRRGMRLDLSDRGLNENSLVQDVTEFSYITVGGDKVLSARAQVSWGKGGFQEWDSIAIPATDKFQLILRY